MLSQTEIEQVKAMLDNLNQYLIDAGVAGTTEADWFIDGYKKCLDDLNTLFARSIQSKTLN